MTRLILVDGFAGSGKSTTAQRLWLDLAAGGRRAVWFHEHEADHPIFQYGEVADLLRWTPRRLETQLLSAWNAFAKADDGRTVRIVEGSFFQIPVGLMLAMNVAPVDIHALILRMVRTIAPLRPSLVHLHRPDLGNAFRELSAERGPQWVDELTAVVGRSPYGRRHRVRDARGLIAYYRRQRAIVDAVLPRLTMRRLSIDVSAGRWAQYGRRMASFLDIRQAAPRELALTGLLRHVGQYRGAKTGGTSVITTDAEALYLQQPAALAQPLLRVGAGHYCVRSLPIDVRFAYDAGGAARRFTCDSRMIDEAGADRSWSRA